MMEKCVYVVTTMGGEAIAICETEEKAFEIVRKEINGGNTDTWCVKWTLEEYA